MLSARSRLKELTEPEPDGDGILYADSPGETAAKENARRERRRRKIVRELFQTEKAYLNHLELIHKFFYFPLRFNCILPEEVHAHLFSNIEQIRDVNRTLLELMEQSTVGQAFKHLGPFLKLYALYANNHEQALAVLQEWLQKSNEFAEFIQTQESRPEIMGLKANALLITPVQRIPRYKLLLEDLLAHTPSDHHDYLQLRGKCDSGLVFSEKLRKMADFYSALKELRVHRFESSDEATKEIGDIAHHINEHIRQHENFQKMLSIQKSFDSSAPKILQPGRIFLKEGPLKKVSRKGVKSHERMFFLFSDVLLYGKPRLVESGGRSYTCCCVLPIKHCKTEQVFVNRTKQTDSSGGGVFKLTCKEEVLMLYSDDKAAAEAWSKAIEKAVRKANDDHQTLRKPSSNKIPLRGRSLRQHRKLQKKADVQVTPIRRQSPKRDQENDKESYSPHLRRQSPTSDEENGKDCCSPFMRKRVEPLHEKIQSWYDNLPATCTTPPELLLESSSSLEEMGNRFSIISERGETLSAAARQRGAMCVESDENFDSFAIQKDLIILPGKYSSSHSCDPVSSSLGSTVSTVSGTEVYYPRGSTLKLNTTKKRISLRSKIKSYFRRPLTRLQHAQQNLTGHSPLNQRHTVVKTLAPKK